MRNADQLKSPKSLIKAAFERGERLTTYTGNQIGHTVDFRKIVSTLRDEGFHIKDYWETAPTDGNTKFTITKSKARSCQRAIINK